MPRPLDDAHEILRTLQAKVDLRDPDGLIDLFADPAVLIGAAGDGRNRDGCATSTGRSPCPMGEDWPFGARTRI